MSDWYPFFFSFTALVVLGLFVPAIISPFVDYNTYTNPLAERFIYFINNGISFDVFYFIPLNFNPFSLFGNDFKIFVINYIKVFTYIPLYISFPIILLIFGGFVYTFIKLLPTT